MVLHILYSIQIIYLMTKMLIELNKKSKRRLTSQISLQLREKICNGELKAESRLPSSMQLAKNLGVAYKTVESAIAELAKDGLVVRYPRKGTFVCNVYQEEQSERKTLKICMLLWTIDRKNYPYVANIIKGVECAEEDIILSIKGMDEYSKNGDNWQEGLRKDIRKYDGLLIDKEGFMTYELLNFLENNKIPRVMLNSPVYEVYDKEFCIMPNYVGGAYKLTEILIKLGHRKFKFLQRYSSKPTQRLRSDITKYSGIKSSLLQHDIPCNEDLCIGGMYNSEQKVYNALKKVFEQDDPPTALICADDIIAFNAINACEKLGYKVPDDISVSGFYNFDIRTVRPPYLTTIDLQLELMGFKAVKNLIERIKGGKIENGIKIFPVRLLEGDSIAPVRK